MDYEYEQEQEQVPGDSDGCPRCGEGRITWQGGDDVVNLGKAATFTHVDWYLCHDCGYKWSESYDHE
jgi:ribosomal protein S27AE